MERLAVDTEFDEDGLSNSGTIMTAPIRLQHLTLLLASLLMLCTGCSRWTVVKQAEPNPFAGVRKVYLEPINYDGLMVQDRSEQEFKAGRDADANENWDRDKQRVNDTFMKELTEEADDLEFVGSAGEGVIVVKTQITNMHGGISLGLTSTNARIEMTVKLALGGTEHDEITLVEETGQNEGFSIGGIATSGYSGSDRLDQTAEKLGDAVAAYVSERAGG